MRVNNAEVAWDLRTPVDPEGKTTLPSGDRDPAPFSPPRSSPRPLPSTTHAHRKSAPCWVSLKASAGVALGCDGAGRCARAEAEAGRLPGRDALSRLPSGDSPRLSVESCGRVRFSRFFIFYFFYFFGPSSVSSARTVGVFPRGVPFLDSLREGRAKGKMAGWERDGVSRGKAGADRPGGKRAASTGGARNGTEGA